MFKIKAHENLALKEIDSGDTITRMAAVYKKNDYVSNIAKEFVPHFGEQMDAD